MFLFVFIYFQAVTVNNNPSSDFSRFFSPIDANVERFSFLLQTERRIAADGFVIKNNNIVRGTVCSIPLRPVELLTTAFFVGEVRCDL